MNWQINSLKKHSPLLWDPLNKVHLHYYETDWLNRFIFIKDEQSFKPKLNSQKISLERGVYLSFRRRRSTDMDVNATHDRSLPVQTDICLYFKRILENKMVEMYIYHDF